MDADLVLEGGGVKGIALVGAISELEERGYRFHRVAGTSAGAIVGSLVAAGVGAGRLREIMQELDYRRFRDGNLLTRLGIPGQVLSILTTSGIYRGEYARGWLGDLLAEHEVRTFADLRGDDPGTSLPPEEDFRLVVMASDVSQGELRRLPWEYDRYGMKADDVEVADAVRASMSIPYYFRAAKLRDRQLNTDSWLVDGGMLSNFPVAVFDRRDDRTPRWPTFGIKLSVRADAALGQRHRITGTLSMSKAMLDTMTGFYDRIHLERADVLARTMFIDTMKVKATDFDLDRSTQQQLFDNGRRAAESFLDGTDGRPGWNFEEYLERYRLRPTTPA
ncbi:patatin-like phospholipase family protein [Phytoactinopolyspora halotolerans]|uniref:Patatin-like phospholipase family protein n=1 Tax=Phytoactinopolyspora halotolerans TaxID=1981512 RepID=A0A6L9SED2_9ACTN|nr:patatin-like phospholipase family protein [Phytoactinopolyspora halotolerans]NEE03419.1 patatin-like phospholipase family protein [Phytoactinopolyspora halotolerans]